MITEVTLFGRWDGQ